MRKKSTLKYEIFSLTFVIVLGIILHFTYDWSGQNLFVGSFSAVNESTWEHLKLIFFPTFITIIIGCFYNKNVIEKYLFSKTTGLIYSLIFTVVFFYTYSGILGYTITFVDILSFFVAVLLGELISIKTFIFSNEDDYKISIVTLLVLLLSFITFTYFPPKINLFKDPITETYGAFRIQK